MKPKVLDSLLHKWLQNSHVSVNPVFSVGVFHGLPNGNGGSHSRFLRALCGLAKRLKLEKSTFMLALVYIKRLFISHRLSKYYMYRLLLFCLLTAIKYNEDYSMSNHRYATFVGLSCRDITYTEMKFLNCIHFDIYVAHEEYDELQQEKNEMKLQCSDTK